MARTLRLLAATAAAVVALSSPAAAHVTVQPPEAAAGSYAKLAFRVPNERDDAATVRLEVRLPAAVGSARLKPVPGWTGAVEGSTITWSGGRIEPGQFQEFEISVGPLPEEAGELELPAVQAYEDGEEVAWVEPVPDGGQEPEHPAPLLRLTAAEDEGPAVPAAALEPGDDGPSTGAVVGAYGVGALGTVLALGSFVRRRRGVPDGS